MENIFEVEKLNSIRNEMTHLWGSVFVTAGGGYSVVFEQSIPSELCIRCCRNHNFHNYGKCIFYKKK